MTEHNVLYIVEGKAEETLLSKLWNRFGIDLNYTVYRYNTNIHVLIELLFTDDKLDEDLDIVRVLKIHETDMAKKAILDRKFEYVYMIFDFDPQDSKLNLDKVGDMIDFFNDPADNGRLFINYPMVESYRHLKSLNDSEFKDRTVSIDTLKSGKYKELVNEECCKDLKQINRYTVDTYKDIIRMHICKENYLINKKFEMMSKEDFLDQTGSELLNVQKELIRNKSVVSVINTCIFTIVEHAPSQFFNENMDTQSN